ncbi:MAG: TonB C-terminal domain-containing protein [Desulfobacteraceae bacterium]|jgi:colicin import membrane protein
MIARSTSYAADDHSQSLFWPVALSIAAHLTLIAIVTFSPSWKSEPEFIPSVIDVQMVDLSDLGAAPPPKAVSPKESAPVVEPKEAAPEPVPEVESVKKPEISVAPKKKETKRALKYKTFKSKKVLENALKRVEKRVDSSPPKPLEDTIKKIREKVSKQGRPETSSTSSQKSDKAAKSGAYGRGSRKEIELIDLYRLDIAYAIQKNWAFADQLSGGGDKEGASIVFKVMPDGTIADIFFTDRSGNQYLDDSAYKAIVKSSPVKPHPDKLSRPYVELGLRFTPEGVR